MNRLVAWKKVLLFGLFGAAGCLAGWLVGEPYLYAAMSAADSAGADQAPTLISNPTAPPTELPREFQDRLKAAGANTGDVQISLIWDDPNDLDLHCVDPSGVEIWYKQKASPSGGRLDVDRNASCKEIDPKPVENIFWPAGGAPQGEYVVYVNLFLQCPGGPPRSEFRLNVLANGERQELRDSVTKDFGDRSRPKEVHRFRVGLRLDAPAEFELRPGRAVKVPLAVRRGPARGPIDVTAENLPDGVLAGKTTIPEGKDTGEIELKAAEDTKETRRAIKFVATGPALSASAESQLTVPKAAQFSLWMVLAIGLWTALLALGLCLALLAGQNRYLGKPLFAPARVPLVTVILGAVAAGFVSGSIGQALFFLFLSVGVAKLGLVLGWVLLGALLGAGVSLFVPNLDAKKAALAGLAGGFLGGVTFWVMSYAADVLGRFGGAALLGFCIGLMVAAVEVAFRRAWLEVRFGEREVITVNLGPEPVKVGGDARLCTVWARGAPEVALRYWIRDGNVHCEDVPAKRESAVADGDTRAAGSVTVVVRTGGAPTPASAAPPPVPPLAASRAEPPPPIPAKPQAAQSAPAPAKPTRPDYDDELPMPVGPPPPARPAVASILDIDDMPAAPKPVAPPAPAVAKAVVPPAPKPPVSTAARPAAPPAPKPPGPASGPKPGDPDACPACGRKSPGRPGARYCMVCDKTF